MPVLNGCYQEAGRERAARILSTAFSNDVERVVMEIAGAYPKKAKVKSVIRTFAYDREKKTFSVTDQVQFKLPGKFSVPILTFGFIEPKGDKGTGRYRLKANVGDAVRECDVTIAVKGSAWRLSDGKRIDNPRRSAPMRYAILLEGPVPSAEISVTFAADEEIIAAARAAEAPPPDAAESELEEKPGPVLFDEETGVKARIVYGGLEERVLAREIQWYLGEMAEERFPLAEQAPEEGPAIIIKVNPDDARVVTQKDRVVITGHGKGLSKAVTHFLEALGVRFLLPSDEYGRVIPGKTKVMYPDSDWREPPSAAPLAEAPKPDKQRLIALLKSPTPVKRGFYAWHGVDMVQMPTPTADGWDLYRTVKGVDAADKAACEALLADFRRAAYGPAARIMNEYFTERAKPTPDTAKLAKIVERALVETAHEPAITARLRMIANSLLW